MAARTATPRDPQAAGITLLELLVVLVIMSALFGLGVGAFRSLARPEETARSLVKDALRTARLHARGAGVPASVVVDPARSTLRTVAVRPAGNWHFEDEAGAGWPVDAWSAEGRLVADGVLGSALALRPPAVLEIAGLPPASLSPDGFGVDVALRPQDLAGPMTLLERRGSWALELGGDGVLQVRLWFRRAGTDATADGAATGDDVGGAAPGPGAGGASDAGGAPEGRAADAAAPAAVSVHAVPAAALRSGRWSSLSVLFDGRVLRVAVDGARVQADVLFPGGRRLAGDPAAPVTAGSGATAYRGDLDELRLSTVVTGAPRVLPEEVRLEGGAATVRVDASGHLDPAWHRAPARIAFTHGEPPRRTVVEYGLLGAVRSWEEDAVARPAADDGPEAGR